MLGKRLKALRTKCKLNQRTLAQRAGVTQPYVVALEKGRENPTLAVLERLAKALKVSVAELVE
jgi:transcriptional regulator with XRE-family HTH domain